MPEGTLLTPGVFLGDEVTQSGDPPRHAADLVGTMLKEGLRWCALQIAPGNERAAELLRDACAGQGAAFGTWAQGLPVEGELAAVRSYGSTFHIANVETPHEDSVWTTPALDELVAMRLPHGVGVIFTEGAWGRDQAKSRRWIERGFVAIPEAIVSENANATIPAMLHLAAVLGWPGERTAPCFYLTRGFAASSYSGDAALTVGRWNLFRYGDIDAADWEAMRAWPHAALPSEPPSQQVKPEQKKRPVQSAGARATAMRTAIVAAVDSWNPTPPPLSRGGLIRRIARANDAAWKKAAPGVLAALEAAGIPDETAPPSSTPAPAPAAPTGVG